MKKISLKNLNLKEVEQLSREQLKSVLGGFTVSTSPSNCSAKCADGSSVSITDCQGTCSCTDNVGCSCSGSETLRKDCPTP